VADLFTIYITCAVNWGDVTWGSFAHCSVTLRKNVWFASSLKSF